MEQKDVHEAIKSLLQHDYFQFLNRIIEEKCVDDKDGTTYIERALLLLQLKDNILKGQETPKKIGRLSYKDYDCSSHICFLKYILIGYGSYSEKSEACTIKCGRMERNHCVVETNSYELKNFISSQTFQSTFLHYSLSNRGMNPCPIKLSAKKDDVCKGKREFTVTKTGINNFTIV